MVGDEEGVAFTVSHEGLEARYVLKPDDNPIRIGRDPENDIVVENRGVSKFHAELRLPQKTGLRTRATYVCASDLSMNGTALRLPGGAPAGLARGEEVPLPNGAELLMPWLQKVKGPPTHLERVSFKVHYDVPVLSPTDAGEEDIASAAYQPDSSGAAEPSAQLGHHPSRMAAMLQVPSFAQQLRQPQQAATGSHRQREPPPKRAADGFLNGHSFSTASGEVKAGLAAETTPDACAVRGLASEEGMNHLRFVEMLLNSQVSTSTTYEEVSRRLGSEPEWQALEDDKRRMLLSVVQLHMGNAQTEIKSKNRGKKQRLPEEPPEDPRREPRAPLAVECPPALASANGPEAGARGPSVPCPPLRVASRRAPAAAVAAEAAALPRRELLPPQVAWPVAREPAARRRPQRLELQAEATVEVKSDPESPSQARDPRLARYAATVPVWPRAPLPEPPLARGRPHGSPRGGAAGACAGGAALTDKRKRRRVAADTSRRNEFSANGHTVMPRSESEETFTEPEPKRGGVKVEHRAVASGPLVKYEVADPEPRGGPQGAADSSLLGRARSVARGGIARAQPVQPAPPVPPAPPERTARCVLVREEAPPARPQPRTAERPRNPAPQAVDDSDDVRTTCAGPVVLRPRARTEATAPPAAGAAPAARPAPRPADAAEAPGAAARSGACGPGAPPVPAPAPQAPQPEACAVEAPRVVLVPRRSVEGTLSGALPAPPEATPIYRLVLSDEQARHLEAALLERAALLADPAGR